MDALDQILSRCRALKTTDDFQEYAGTPARLKDRICAIDHFPSEDDSWCVSEAVVAEAYRHGFDDKYGLTLLVNSCAKLPLEVGHGGVGKYLRANQPGNLVFLDVAALEQLQGASGGLLNSITLSIDKRSLHDRLSRILEREPPSLEVLISRTFRDDVIEQLLKQLLSESRKSRDTALPSEPERILDRLCGRLLILAGQKIPTAVKVGDKLPAPSIQRVVSYMREHLGQEISRTDLARVAGVSPCHFSRLFHQTLGQPPKSYLLNLQIERAKELLRTLPPETRLEDIARQCGFSSPTRMCDTFRNKLGVAPGFFRLDRPQ
ncbi:MAG: hypothetical protein C0478_04600 [Planctomyces sp.]|nr:hypothetical protein [Planctomyces sp.]